MGTSQLQYQSTQLGCEAGDSLLIELLPYPKQSRRDWPEICVERGFATQSEYVAAMLPRRLAYLSPILTAHDRELIVFYGKEHSHAYRALLAECDWEPEGVFLRSKMGTGRAVLAPHFTSVSFARSREQFFDLCLR